ncbi:MAG: GAF domain-containing protein [Rhodocyclaceae bacterium]|nr:GAF domain-containing protein [Rhodocyclaceae bacterium]
MNPGIASLRECLDGAIPATIATCDPDGTPNVAFLSQVQFVDDEHVALSYQFFNRTRRNVLANPQVTVLIASHLTMAQFRLSLHYLHTETAGPLFEQMKAKLAGIASHTGMSGIFRLLGADIYRITDIQALPGPQLPPPPQQNLLPAMRRVLARIDECADLERLLPLVLGCLEKEFGIRHSMLLFADAAQGRLYTIASRGYAQSGVGSEIPVGHGVIGVAAREGVPIRISHMTSEYAYSRAIRASLREGGTDGSAPAEIDMEIPLPGLPEARSQLAVPMLAGRRRIGVLYVESTQDSRFGYDDEDVLVAIAAQLAMSVHLLQQAGEAESDDSPPAPRADAAPGAPLDVRHYAQNDSVFLGNDYLIKGVAGAILWALLRDYAEHGRTDFSNRELRLNPAIRLPDLADNLEARLVLLQRRLEERTECLRIRKLARGRFRLCVSGTLHLSEA